MKTTASWEDTAERTRSEVAPGDRSNRWAGWVVFSIMGALALVAADLLHRALAWRGSAEMWHAVETWVPTLVPAHAGYTVDPWPALIWVMLLGTLVFVSAAFATAILTLVWERPWWARLLPLWGAAVLTAVVVAGLAQAGGWLLQVETFGGRGGSHIRMFVFPALEEAVRWGLLWGWIPALATVVIRPPRPTGRARRRALFVAVALLAAAAVAGACLVAATRGAALSAQTAVAQPAAKAETTEDDAVDIVTAPTSPPAEVAATAAPDFPGRCAEDDVEVVILGVDAATGSRFLALEARNTSDMACELQGAPDLAFTDDAGDEILPVIVTSERVGSGPAPDAPVTVAPGEAVRADLSWRAPTGRPGGLTVLMAPWPGAHRVSEVETLDVVDGAEMALTPWYVEE
ncbi:DUF4232 domain-containing protein [Microbacterium karelineae]|uniref:DUF4232 domain-containing protein n=1 Tax=Microbacterium karelineae TaxID=2654283 RepID=UPI0012E998BF|nr:DUF4232 domain-containing protein [Microbacterium karelineae]